MLDRANSLSVPTGRTPARGWLLMARSDYDNIDPYSVNLQLQVANPARPDNVGALGHLTVVQAQCATRGRAADPAALYLIEVTDRRGVLESEWSRHPTVSTYNIRAPAYPLVFQPSSMDGPPPTTTTWTWSRMVQSLWEQMPLLGAYPGLPYAPRGTPEGFWFTGVGAWSALCDILDHLGMTVACDLTSAAPYTIVSNGASDATLTALQARYTKFLEDDAEWIDTGSGRVPGTVVVLFRRRNLFYGSEETTPYRDDATARQWNMSAVYSVSVPAPATFSTAAGTHYIWSDFTVAYDQDGQPYPSEVIAARAIAEERVSQYFDRIYSRTFGHMAQTYAGALPFTTGSQVDGVAWYQDRSESRHDWWGGWRTHICRGSSATWSGLYDRAGG